MRDHLKDEFEERHASHRRLRKFWHGRYWENTEVDTRGLASIFRDVKAPQSDIGPDYKLVYNIIKDVCVKFQTYLAPLPMIKSYIDPPVSNNRKAQAVLKERYLYGVWEANNMNAVMANQGWFLPLMGDCFLGIYPDVDNSMCRPLLRSPEHAFPLVNWDLSSSDGFIFSWKAKASQIKRAFPNWSPDDMNAGKNLLSLAPGKRRPQPSDPEVEILEYSDRMEFDRWIGGKKMLGVDHGFGFDLFEHVKFINVPGEAWGHGAVEQAVNLVEMSNAYLSLMMQSAIENVFPVMVLEDPMKAPETIERGAGSVIPVNAGGKVYYLQPPSGNLVAQGEFQRMVEEMIQRDTSMPDVNFGQAQNSIITGKAINELQGAGTGTLVEMVQGVGIGAALSAWNEKAINIGRTMFKDDTIRLYGSEVPGLADLNPRHFSMNIKGSQLVGSARNDVVFMPYLDMQQKVVIGLQMAGAGLVSRKWQRDNVGIPDSEAMDEEIVGEAIQDAVLGMIVQAIQSPDMAAGAEQRADTFIEANGSLAPHPLLAAPPPPALVGAGGGGNGPGGGGAGQSGSLPIAPLPGPGGGQVESSPIKLPPGAPVPQGEPSPGPAGSPGVSPQGQGIALPDAIQAFQSLQGIQGQIFLVGEIVQTGSTQDALDVDITNPADRDTISQGVQLPMTIKIVNGPPNEPYIEVTPGASTAMQGEMPQPEEAM